MSSAGPGVRGNHLVAKNADRDLRRHQQLPEMGRRPLIGLAGRAEHRDVTEDQGKRGDRHRQWEQSRGSLQRGDRQA